MVTSSFVDIQLPLLIVHFKVALVPAVKPVTVVIGLVALVIVPLPDCNVHKPVPITAALPPSVAVALLHSSWSAPANATVGTSEIIILTSSLLLPHPPLLIVQRNTAVVPAVKSLMAVL